MCVKELILKHTASLENIMNLTLWCRRVYKNRVYFTKIHQNFKRRYLKKYAELELEFKQVV